MTILDKKLRRLPCMRAAFFASWLLDCQMVFDTTFMRGTVSKYYRIHETHRPNVSSIDGEGGSVELSGWTKIVYIQRSFIQDKYKTFLLSDRLCITCDLWTDGRVNPKNNFGAYSPTESVIVWRHIRTVTYISWTAGFSFQFSSAAASVTAAVA